MAFNFNSNILASSSKTSSSPMASPSASASFSPPSRPFPPPALQDVPIPYILNQLHNLALNYWDKPQTADCTIVVPIVPQRSSARNSPSTPSTPNYYPPHNHGPAGLGRHPAQPTPLPSSRPTRMTSKLHLDYLLAQSSLFRDLFSEKHATSPRPQLLHHQQHNFQMPRILPSPPDHPVVHLPLPDPASFPHLVHFMYFGTFEVLERALDNGEVRWEDVVRNVEYLGMRVRMRSFLKKWRAVASGVPVKPIGRVAIARGGSEVDDEESTSDDGDVFSESSMDDEDEDRYSDDDDGEEDEDSDQSETDGSLETLVDDEPLAAPTKYFRQMDIDDEPPRGRSRTRISPTAASHSPLRQQQQQQQQY